MDTWLKQLGDEDPTPYVRFLVTTHGPNIPNHTGPAPADKDAAESGLAGPSGATQTPNPPAPGPPVEEPRATTPPKPRYQSPDPDAPRTTHHPITSASVSHFLTQLPRYDATPYARYLVTPTPPLFGFVAPG